MKVCLGIAIFNIKCKAMIAWYGHRKLPSLYPSSTRRVSKKLNMTFIPSFKHPLRRMITNQTWPPRMSFEFRPYNSTLFNFHRARFPARIFQRSWSFRRFWRSRFLIVNRRKPLCAFLWRIILLFICCISANRRRGLFRFWSEIRKQSRHVYSLAWRIFPRFSTTSARMYKSLLVPRFSIGHKR